MKKIITIGMMLVLMLQIVLAQNAVTPYDEIELPHQNVLPGNPFYGLDVTIERLQLAFTFNNVEKAQMRLEIAQERLAELEQVSEQTREEYQKWLLARYNEEMTAAEELAEEISTENVINGKEINAWVDAVNRFNEEVLNRIRTRLAEDDNPDNDDALQGLDKAIDNAQLIKERTRTSLDEINERGFKQKVVIGNKEY